MDTETGLYYYGYRYYDPRTSVWQSPDPALGAYLPSRGIDDSLQFNAQPAWRWEIDLPGRGGAYLPQNLGLYSYAWDNPLIFIDPDGFATGQGQVGAGVHRTELSPRAKAILATVGFSGLDIVQLLIPGEGEGADITEIPEETAVVKGILKEGESKVEQKVEQKVLSQSEKQFSKEKQALVDMAKKDKKIGMTREDMKAYKELNKELKDPFSEKQIHGPETHPNRGPSSQLPHGHVGPVEHIPIVDK